MTEVKETVAAATAAPVVAAPAMPEQNGIRMPRPGSNCALIWDKATIMSTEKKATVAIGDLLVVLVAAGFNQATIKTQYARWRKFHGVEGRVDSEAGRLKREAADKAKADKIAAKEAGKQAKLDAKQAKVDKKAADKLASDVAKKEKAEAAAAKKAAAEAEKAAKAAEAAAAKAEADAAAAAGTQGE